MADVVAQDSLVLLYEGQRHPIGPEGVTLGRSADNDIPMAVEKASRRHARVVATAAGLVLEDVGSTHGTSLNGEHFRGEQRPLSVGDRIEIAGAVIRVLGGGETRFEPGEVSAAALKTEVVPFNGSRLTIGRQPGNDLVLPDPNVSRMHAELVARDGHVELVDLGSSAGTRVDGAPARRTPVAAGSVIGIGPYEIHFDGQRVAAHDSRTELRMNAHQVEVRVGDKQILKPVSLAVEPGELVVLIGASGAGKTTLLKVLAGVNRPSGGAVTVNDEPLSARLTDVGYVPQQEIVHPQLTVREALTYAARLRLPQDTTPEEIEETVARVLDELSLEAHANTLIGSLSGGQRKRAGVGVELLSRPSLLFLDEPTTGLDPSLEGRLMKLLRDLADAGRGVVVVTHATASLDLADRIVVMAEGGERVFDGRPADALAFFGVDAYEQIYEVVDESDPQELRGRFEAGTGAAPQPSKPAHDTAPARRPPRLLRQARVLSARQARVFLRDRKNLLILLAQVPILGLLDSLIFHSDIFEKPGGTPGDAIQLTFMIVLGPLWFGTLDSAREIVKERTLREREAATGVRVPAYLISKCAVLFPVVAIQTLLLAAIILTLRPLHEPFADHVAILVILVLIGWAAVGLGLLVSAAVTSEDQALTLIPLVMIPQLLFSGAVVPVERMLQPFRALAELHISQWGVAAVGTQVDLNERMAQSAEFARTNRFGESFFDMGLVTAATALTAFAVVFLALVTAILHRRSRQSRA